MKTRWERYCELRNFDNWCLRNPHKANLVSILAGLVIFALAQLLQILPPVFLLVLIFGSLLFFAFAGDGQ
jgi:hypothetical protein